MRQGDLAAILRSLPESPWRECVAQAVAEGVASCDAYIATTQTIASASMGAWHGAPRSDAGTPWALLSVGKAAVGMAQAVLDAAATSPAACLVGSLSPKWPGLDGVRCEHPDPGPGSLRMGTAALAMARALSPGVPLVACVSGGASSMLCGWSPDQHESARALIRQLRERGVPIESLNAIRCALDPLKGGGLRRALGRRPVLTLVLSDTPGHPPSLVGSGPTLVPVGAPAALEPILRDAGIAPEGLRALLTPATAAVVGTATRDEHDLCVTVADADTLADGVLDGLSRRGVSVLRGPPLQGSAFRAGEDAARDLLAESRPVAVVQVGECTTRVNGPGRGGRSMEFALGFATVASRSPGLATLALTSDGVDGNSGASGAVAHSNTELALRRHGLSVDGLLSRSDSATGLGLIDGLISLGPTGTNVADVAVSWRAPDG